MPERTPLVGGNWKMNTNLAGASELARQVGEGAAAHEGVEVAIFPPFPYLIASGESLAEARSRVRLGAQDLWTEPDGAFTGEVSTAMLRDCGAEIVLTGHSERRHVIGEDDDRVGAKTRAALEAGLTCVLCIGETLEERDAAQTDAVNVRQARAGLDGVSKAQMERVVIAYEPVWAIGTGKTATPDDAQDAHAKIRALIEDLHDADVAQAIRIIYGGSMKPANAVELLAQPDIDGGLIGGAALKAEDFIAIVAAAGA
ncbi:MAG: triose-phosphate isomerase [Planctomycetota bacterium]